MAPAPDGMGAIPGHRWPAKLDTGVLMVLVLGTPAGHDMMAGAPTSLRRIAEAKLALEALRQGPALTVALYRDTAAGAALADAEASWDLTLTRTCASCSSAYQHKLFALASTPFSRSTVFVDNDLFVLDAGLVTHLASQILRVADVAMPVDPAWGNGRLPTAPRYRGASQIPEGCTALLAFRTTPPVLSLFRGALQRLHDGRHLNQTWRVTDQEVVWYQWIEAQPELRVLLLPEEYFCPLVQLPRQRGRRAPRRPLWQTSWRGPGYACRSVHGHGYTRRTLLAYISPVLTTGGDVPIHNNKRSS